MRDIENRYKCKVCGGSGQKFERLAENILAHGTCKECNGSGKSKDAPFCTTCKNTGFVFEKITKSGLGVDRKCPDCRGSSKEVEKNGR